MSVSIGGQGPQSYVELSHGGKTVQIPCKDEEEAKKVAEQAQIVEQKMTEKEQSKQGNGKKTAVNLNEGTPKEGVAQKLDLAA